MTTKTNKGHGGGATRQSVETKYKFLTNRCTISKIDRFMKSYVKDPSDMKLQEVVELIQSKNFYNMMPVQRNLKNPQTIIPNHSILNPARQYISAFVRSLLVPMYTIWASLVVDKKVITKKQIDAATEKVKQFHDYYIKGKRTWIFPFADPVWFKRFGRDLIYAMNHIDPTEERIRLRLLLIVIAQQCFADKGIPNEFYQIFKPFNIPRV